MKALDTYIDATAVNTGVPPDLLRIVACLGFSFPLCGLVKRLNSAAARELVCLGGGLFFLVGIFNLWQGLVTLLFSSAVTYGLVSVWPNKWLMPWLNFATIMGLMLVTHIKEQLGDSGDFVNEIGISGSQMILVIKLTSLGWDVYDGTRPVETLSDYQKQSRVTPELLSPIRFLAWVFFFPAILTGPACGYREFGEWLDGTLTKGPIPRSGHIALLKAAEGIVYAYLYIQMSDVVLNSAEFFRTEAYTQLSFAWRAVFFYGIGIVMRFKYYSAWLIAEAACIHCGLGFRGIDPTTGRMQWDRVRNVNPLKVELAQNMHDFIGNWNMNTIKWLRHYVYLRVTPKGKKPGTFATLATFSVSALWHGVMAGYYLTFITAAFLQMIGKVFRRRLRPLFVGTSWKRPYDALTWVVTQLAGGYCVAPFFVMYLRSSLLAWMSVYFYIHLGIIASWLLLAGPLKHWADPILQALSQNLRQND